MTTIAEFTLPSEPGNERQAISQVVEAIRSLGLPHAQLERLKTAVSETTMNAMEHGNRYRQDKDVNIKISLVDRDLIIQITDQSGDQPLPEQPEPDLEAKLAGLQSPRGWGLFLIKNMVDEMNVISDMTHHTVELIFHLEGGENGKPTV